MAPGRWTASSTLYLCFIVDANIKWLCCTSSAYRCPSVRPAVLRPSAAISHSLPFGKSSAYYKPTANIDSSHTFARQKNARHTYTNTDRHHTSTHLESVWKNCPHESCTHVSFTTYSFLHMHRHSHNEASRFMRDRRTHSHVHASTLLCCERSRTSHIHTHTRAHITQDSRRRLAERASARRRQYWSNTHRDACTALNRTVETCSSHSHTLQTQKTNYHPKYWIEVETAGRDSGHTSIDIRREVYTFPKTSTCSLCLFH